jgi:hypothetical protein
MSDDTDMIRGSGSVFRDPSHPDADREQPRALLAARILFHRCRTARQCQRVKQNSSNGKNR